ncbi:hypothetical protein [Sphingomonas sp. SAFR-052]|uniref:hypothetical protein n=1 Tax=Sphingomonas sp. SAFR-052 TaxID=3436867 RepID=UPI003F7DE135
MQTDAEVAAIAAGLTDQQRGHLARYVPGEWRMGGYGADCGCPGLIERGSIHHPVFGSHYRLTDLGLRVAQHLKQENAK